MGNCKDCKHWDDFDAPVRECNAPKMLKGYGYTDAEIPSEGALVEDDEGWGIRTGPYFGCVLFDQK